MIIYYYGINRCLIYSSPKLGSNYLEFTHNDKNGVKDLMILYHSLSDAIVHYNHLR